MACVLANHAAAECAWLGDMLKQDEPRVRAYVEHLQPGKSVAGLMLCDGSTLFKDWVFVGRGDGFDPSQSVFLFTEGGERRAVAWVLAGGKELAIPQCSMGPKCADLPEGSEIISGDIYTWRAVRPGQEIVIIRYPLDSWSAT